MRFSTVNLRKPKDEDTNVGGKNEISAFNNLYEMMTLASLHAKLEDEENQNPQEKADFDDNPLAICWNEWIAIGVGCDVSLFSYDYDFAHRFTWELKEPVVAVTALGTSDYFAVFTANQEFHLLSTKSSTIIHSADLSPGISLGAKTPKAAATSQTDAHSNICQILYNDNLLLTACITIGNWSRLVSSKISSSEEFIKGRFEDYVHIHAKSTNCNLYEIHSLPGGDVVGVPRKSGALQLLSTNSLAVNTLLENGISDVLFVRTRLTCDGRFLVGMTSLGNMVVRDMWTLQIVYEFNVIDTEEFGIVVDFMFTDDSDIDFTHDSIAVIVFKDNTFHLQIRSLSTGKFVYSVAVRSGAIPLVAPINSDRVMIVIEPLRKDIPWCDAKNSLKIREISETKPETRLDRLITRKQLDDAEKFAIEMGLDVQRVYEARMELLINEVLESSGSEADDVFERLVKSMEAVNDHNLVGEQCYRGAVTFQKYDWINRMLSIASKRAISDVDIANRLQQLKYIFATYRLVSGTSSETPFGDDSLWSRFRRDIDATTSEDCVWVQIFNDFVAFAYFQEATIIYERHNAAVQAGLIQFCEESCTFPLLEAFFANITNAVKDDLDKWKQSIEFLEFTILPSIISSAAVHVSSMMVSYLVYVSTMLESWAAEEFPANALHVMSLVERLAKRLTEKAITPTSQADLLQTRHMLQLPEARFAEAEARVLNLRRMERLKTIYDCRLSYSKFMELNTEQICYRILDSAIKNPNSVSTKIAKYCRPYMDEHNLDTDLTLFGFVEEASMKSKGIVTASNPWDEHCLLICNTIEKYAIKCRAVTMIAKGAHPPWSAKLDKTVKEVLANPQTDKEIVLELQRVVHLMQLGVIMTSYGVSIALVDSVLRAPSQFISFIRFIFRGSDRHPDEARRLLDAVKAMNLYREIVSKPIVTMTPEYVHIMFAAYLQQSNSSNKAMVDYVNSLGSGSVADRSKRIAEAEGTSTADYAKQVLEVLLNNINYSVVQKDEKSIAERVATIVSAESLIEHFLRDDAEHIRTAQQLKALRRLQEKHNTWTTFSHLDNPAWRSSALRAFIAEGAHTLTAIQLYASALAMSMDEAAYVAIEAYAECKNFMACMTIMRAFLLAVPEPSLRLTESCISACALYFRELPTLCPEDLNETHEGSEIDDAITLIDQVRDVLSNIYEAADRHSVTIIENTAKTAGTKKQTEAETSSIEALTRRTMPLSETVLMLFNFTELFSNMVSQCLMENGSAAAVTATSAESQRTAKQQGLIMGMGRRVGVYQMQNDGPLLARMEAVPLLCAVAPSVGTNLATLTDEQRQTFMADMQNKWESVFVFLSLQNQYLLEYSSRTFAANTPCCLEVRQSILDGLYNCSRYVCERALEMHPCDLWTTCLMMGSFSPDVTKKLIIELRTWISGTNRKSAQTMINYLRTVQLFVVIYNMKEFIKPLADSFIKYMWAKRLGKAGVNPAVNGSNLKKALEEFARGKLEPYIVHSFLVQFSVDEDIPRHMVNYALMLLRNAARESDQLKSKRLLDLGRITLMLSECSPEIIFGRLSSLIYVICPYNHEVLIYLTSILHELIDKCPDDEAKMERASFVAGCRRILDFLSVYRRERTIGSDEVAWYLQHSKMLAANSEDGLTTNLERLVDSESELLRSYRDGWPLDGLISDAADAMELADKGRGDILVSAVPNTAEKLLPFHPFMFRTAGDISKYLLPMILNEMTIYNVKDWQLLVRHVGWLRESNLFNRPKLMSTAIIRKSQECIGKGDEMTKIELSAIHNLMLNSAPNVVSAAIMACYTDIPLSNAKVCVLQLAVDVASDWLQDSSKSFSEQERREIEMHRMRLTMSIRKLRTRQILQKAGLYDTKTSEMSGDPAALVSHVYGQCINWDDASDIDRKTLIISQLAEVNEMADLSAVQMELVRKWVPENASGGSEEYAVDLNDTMGGGGGGGPFVGGGSSDSDSEIYLLPFSEPSITGIVHLLRLLSASAANTTTMIRYLQQITDTKDSSNLAGGYKTMIRAVCVLLRAYTSEQLLEVAKLHFERVVVVLECAQFCRLLELANQGLTMPNFHKANKQQLALRLAGPGIRHTPQLCFALACLVIDHSITDRAIVEMLLNKLYAARKTEMFTLLLQYCRQHSALRNTKNLAMFWARGYDQAVAAIVPSSSDRAESLRHWLSFCLSCPVQGGRAFDPICSSLRAQGDELAAMLVHVVSDFTQPSPPSSTGLGRSNKMSIMLNWNSASPSPATVKQLSPSSDSFVEEQQDEPMFI